ncbi:transposase [Kyrpidia spormannii]|uniref:Transposase n=1 Tax=Kyrpidia spormannii TaxID=2055160 RepID=A0A6F9EAC2_9BACL|nr:transposase [Kyrpidia spormannii]CAB3393828.1 transposase [Kyrpidia spormannii]
MRSLAAVIKTIRIGIHKEVHRCKTEALKRTKEIYNAVIAFFIEFFAAHLDVLDKTVEARKKDGTPTPYLRKHTNQELLTFAELHTLATKAHPNPGWPLDEHVPAARGMPTELRRAAINQAIGKVRSWWSHLKTWEETAQDQRGREPRPGAPNEPVTFYAGMVEHPAYDLNPQKKKRHTFISLKLHTGQKWEKVSLPVVVHAQAESLLAGSALEKERIARKRKRSKTTQVGFGEEKGGFGAGTWVAKSLTVYGKRDKRYPGGVRYALHIPMEKSVDKPRKAEEQRRANPQMPVVTVDLGVGRLAVMGAFVEGKLAATRFVDGRALNHRRHRLLTAIHRKREQSGRLQPAVQDNANLWNKIRNLDENAAKQTAVTIVRFAREHGARVIVFEHLRRYRPPKEKMSRSGRKNHKRAYWLRGQIMEWVRDLAFREGILTVERNPAYTSQVCPHCKVLGERGGSRFTCKNPNHRYSADADFVGMMNLYRKWTKTFVYPRKGDDPKPEVA